MADNAWFLGMTTHAEQAYFEEYARTKYSGVGAIVDLGCWLGSTTIALARGLAENPSLEARATTIHAFDQFVWEEWMGQTSCCQGTEIADKFKPGESFLDEFHKRIEPWADRIQVYEGDLCHIGWGGEPIEFLLIDAMKSWDLTNGILRDFYPFLIPGRSYILHQDFAHFYESWIHLTHYRLRKYFQLVHVVPHSQSFVFHHVRKIPAELLTTTYHPANFSDEEVGLAFEYSLSLTKDSETRAAIAASKVMHFLHLGDAARARIALDKVIAAGVPVVGDLKVVREQMEQCAQ